MARIRQGKGNLGNAGQPAKSTGCFRWKMLLSHYYHCITTSYHQHHYPLPTNTITNTITTTITTE